MIGVNVSHTKLIHKLFEVPMGEVTLKGPFSAHFVRKTFLSERIYHKESQKLSYQHSVVVVHRTQDWVFFLPIIILTLHLGKHHPFSYNHNSKKVVMLCKTLINRM